MRIRLGIAVLSLGLVTAAVAAEDNFGEGFTVSGSAAALTDFVSRGISQTQSRPAIQGALELSHESGVYLGAFANNVAYPRTNARQEVDLSGGYRLQLSGLDIDIGATWYTFPGYKTPPRGSGLNYAEAILTISYTAAPVTFLGTAAYMPGFIGPYGHGAYLEAGADWQTPLAAIVLSGRVGYQWIGRNDRFGTPDYLNYAIEASRALGHGLTIHAGWIGTNLNRAHCNSGQKVCDGRFLAALAWKF